MKIVIDIDKDRYEDIKRIASVQINRRVPTVEQIISNGTSLPKGHGKIIDVNDLLNGTCLDDIPAIIEADKESEE